MKICKRIEIVIEQPLASRMSELLVELGAPGYTLISNAAGRGDRGVRRADEPPVRQPTVCSLSPVMTWRWWTKLSKGFDPYFLVLGVFV